MDKGDLAGALPQLTQVKKMLADVKAAGASTDALADMGVLVDGFLDLARSMEERAKAEAAAAKVEAPPPPAPVAANAETIVNRPPPVYSAADSDVKAPGVVRQQLPSIPHSVARSMAGGKMSGILEILINEKGRVDSVLMREAVNPVFDSVILDAARTWQYRPATKGGEPVKYLKRIAVAVPTVPGARREE
jgi:outer membrane biosynthesis protein TonB